MEVYYNNLNSIFFKMKLNKTFEMFFCSADLDPQKKKKKKKENKTRMVPKFQILKKEPVLFWNFRMMNDEH